MHRRSFIAGSAMMRFYCLEQRLCQLAVLGRMEYRQSQAVLHFLNSLRLSS